MKKSEEKLYDELQSMSKQLDNISDGIVLIAEKIAEMDKANKDRELIASAGIAEILKSPQSAPLSQIPPPTNVTNYGNNGVTMDGKEQTMQQPAKAEAEKIDFEGKILDLKKRVLMFAAGSAIFFVATMSLLSINKMAAVVTVLIAAAFIFMFNSAFAKLGGMRRLAAIDAAATIAKAKAEADEKAANAIKASGGKEEPKTHWERES